MQTNTKDLADKKRYQFDPLFVHRALTHLSLSSATQIRDLDYSIKLFKHSFLQDLYRELAAHETYKTSLRASIARSYATQPPTLSNQFQTYPSISTGIHNRYQIFPASISNIVKVILELYPTDLPKELILTNIISNRMALNESKYVPFNWVGGNPQIPSFQVVEAIIRHFTAIVNKDASDDPNDPYGHYTAILCNLMILENLLIQEKSGMLEHYREYLQSNQK